MLKANIKLSIINDEVDDDIGMALQFLDKQNIQYIELRTLFGENIINLNTTQINDLKIMLNHYKVRVSAISSPLFKWYREGYYKYGSKASFGINEVLDIETKLDYIRKTFMIAKLLNTNYVRIFSLLRGTENPNLRFWELEKETYDLAFNLAVKNNVTLLVENGWYTHFYKTQQLSMLLDEFENLPMRILLDAGNFFYIDESKSIGEINEVAASIPYFHLKDYSSTKKEFVPVGEGIIPYKNILNEAKKSNYDNVYFSIELDNKKDKKEVVEKSIINFNKMNNEE